MFATSGWDGRFTASTNRDALARRVNYERSMVDFG
jgi:hypothetical protein